MLQPDKNLIPHALINDVLAPAGRIVSMLESDETMSLFGDPDNLLKEATFLGKGGKTILDRFVGDAPGLAEIPAGSQLDYIRQMRSASISLIAGIYLSKNKLEGFAAVVNDACDTITRNYHLLRDNIAVRSSVNENPPSTGMTVQDKSTSDSELALVVPPVFPSEGHELAKERVLGLDSGLAVKNALNLLDLVQTSFSDSGNHHIATTPSSHVILHQKCHLAANSIKTVLSRIGESLGCIAPKGFLDKYLYNDAARWISGPLASAAVKLPEGAQASLIALASAVKEIFQRPKDAGDNELQTIAKKAEAIHNLVMNLLVPSDNLVEKVNIAGEEVFLIRLRSNLR